MIKDIHDSNRRKAKDVGRHWRCFLNGEDITLKTFYADTRRGIVRVLKLKNGRSYVDWHGGVATETLHGKVRLVRVTR